MKKVISLILSIAIFTVLLDSGIDFANENDITIECESFDDYENFAAATEQHGETVYAYTTAPPETKDYNALYKFNITDGNQYYMFVRAKSPSSTASLSYFSIDENAPFVFFRKSSAAFSWTRVDMGYLGSGEHCLKIKAGKVGQQFDKFIITSDSAFSPYEQTKEETAEENADYYPSVAELENDTTIPFFEEHDGSWFFEAEDGLLSAPMETHFDETASGETYMAAKLGSAQNREPYSNEPHARYKFKVSKKGKYKLYMRYYAPSSASKSSWVSIDSKVYTEHNVSVSNVYKYSGFNYYLDEGWHTVDFQYRQSGERIDCFILTNDQTFTPSGLGSLPGEEIRPMQLTYEQRKIPRIFINDVECTANVDIKKVGSSYMTPIRAFAEMYGIEFYDNGDYVLLSKGRTYFKVKAGEKEAVSNGEKIALPEAPYYVDDALIVDFASFAKAFGIKWSTDDGIRINAEPISAEDSFEQSSKLEIYSKASEEISYCLDLPDKDAKITAYVKTDGENMWVKGNALRYCEDGKWYGSFEDLPRQKSGTVKLAVISNGEISYHYKSFDKLVWCEYPTVYSLLPHGDGLILKSTFENISYYLDVDEDAHACGVYYKKASENEWKPALTPFYDEPNLQFRGSITNLCENTEYVVRAVVSKNGAQQEFTAKITTWAENVPIAKEIGLSEIFDSDSENGGLVLENIKGTPDGWIKITADECDTVWASDKVNSAIYVANCEYMIFEGIKVKGGNKNGFSIVNNSENIRIINCDISGWGRYGVRPQDTMINEEYDGSSINNDAAIKIMNVGNIVVERVYAHDPHGRTNSWKWGHPCGMNAIFVRGRGGVVIRYNDFLGSDTARWNDSIECKGNGTINGGLTMDSDVYGNNLMFGNDDAIEFDDAQMNVRFYNNRVEGFLCGVSTVPMMVGPSYVYRNLFANLGDDRNTCNNVMKNGGSYPEWSYGIINFINNTCYVKCTGIGNVGWKDVIPNNLVRMFGRNNIIVSGEAPTYYPVKDSAQDPISSYDYDVMATITGAEPQNIHKKDDELHGIISNPEFVSEKEGRFDLKPKSPAIDSGCIVSNFADEFSGKAPDIGALEYCDGEAAAVPVRPVTIRADKYQVTVPEGAQEDTVRIYFGDDVPKNSEYTLLVNELTNWFTVENGDGGLTGVVNPGEYIDVKVRTDSSKNEGFAYANGVFLVRLDSGYSLSVTVYGGKY